MCIFQNLLTSLKFPLFARREYKEEIQEVIVSLAIAEEICSNAAKEAVLNQPDDIFTLKED